LENLPSGAHPSACPSHHARAHVLDFFSHAASMSRTARHAPAAARHLIPAPSTVRSSPTLHSVLLHVASFRQHRSPGIGLKPTPAQAISSSSPRRCPPQAAHGAALPRVAVFVSQSLELHPTPSCAVRSPLRRLPPGLPAVSAVITRSRSSLPSARGIAPPCAPVPKLTEATPTIAELHLLAAGECTRLFFPAGRAQLPSPFSPHCRFPSKGPSSTDRAGRR
jgi:hypothetical protein